MKTFTTFATLLILLSAWHPTADAALKTVALTGDIAPGTNNNFTSFLSGPVLNNAGQTAFRGVLSGSTGTDRGIWSEGGGGGLALVARAGNTAPGTTDNFTFFSAPSSITQARRRSLGASIAAAFPQFMVFGRKGEAAGWPWSLAVEVSPPAPAITLDSIP